MLFNSYGFIFLFLPVALLGYFGLNHFKQITLGKMWLIAASLYFYSYWNIKNLPLLLTSILVNYAIGQYLQKDISWKKNLFRFGLVFNVGLLCFFKYAGLVGFAKIALPLGISFFTLQQIGFLVDAYEGLNTEKSFLDYTVFVSFFPQLISGPIGHFQHLMPQIENPENKRFNIDQFSLGLFVFCLGFLSQKPLPVGQSQALKLGLLWIFSQLGKLHSPIPSSFIMILADILIWPSVLAICSM